MKGKELIVACLAFEINHNSQGFAPSLIVIRVALGLSNTSSGGLRNGGTRSVPRPISTHVHLQVGNGPTASPDAGQHFPSSEILMSRMKSKSLGEHLGSVENVIAV